MLRFCSLGSGSTGNATLVEARSGNTTSRLLIDCGFSLRELNRRLQRQGLSADDIDGVFVTHEHGDHIGCVLTLAKRHRVPVWMSHGTWEAAGEPELTSLVHFAADLQTIAVGDIELTPYEVPHDAGEPLQLRCTDGASRLGVLTDAGSSTPHLLLQLQHCHAMLLECNHDRAMLKRSAYPPSLKSRIGGTHGHLANDTAAEILAACLHPGLNRLVAAHLSQQNNSPELARAALAPVLGGNPSDVVVADPLAGFDWIAVA